MRHLDLLVIGDANPDLILSGGDVHPRFGQVETMADEAHLVLGGSATITAVGAARLGIEVGVCAVVGDDDLGRFMVNRLVAENVDIGRIYTHDTTPTGITLVLVDDSDRAMITAPGTISALDPSHLEKLPDRPAAHVHIASYYLMSQVYRRALPSHLRRFRANGCTTSLDTNWDPSESWDLAALLSEVDVFLPNENELLAITGATSIDDALVRSVYGETSVIVKAGQSGAAALVDGSVLRVPAPDIGSFVDAIGAGDSFNAGYLVARADGLAIGDALKVAAAVGSLSTRGAGGTSSQPDHDEAWRVAGVSR